MLGGFAIGVPGAVDRAGRQFCSGVLEGDIVGAGVVGIELEKIGYPVVVRFQANRCPVLRRSPVGE